jgi:putative transposase
MTQIWIALCVYLLLAFLKFQSKLTKSMQQMLRLLQLNLFEKRDLMALLRGDPLRNDQMNIYQMTLILKLTGQQWVYDGKRSSFH